MLRDLHHAVEAALDLLESEADSLWLEAEDRFKGDCYSARGCTGKVLQRRVLHCHNCKKHISGRSILRPDGTCENC